MLDLVVHYPIYIMDMLDLVAHYPIYIMDITTADGLSNFIHEVYLIPCLSCLITWKIPAVCTQDSSQTGKLQIALYNLTKIIYIVWKNTHQKSMLWCEDNEGKSFVQKKICQLQIWFLIYEVVVKMITVMHFMLLMH